LNQEQVIKYWHVVKTSSAGRWWKFEKWT